MLRGPSPRQERLSARSPLEGTLFLLAAGAALGMGGGLAYVALRRWLPSQGTGLAFGLLMLAVSGRLLVNPDNVDFVILDPAWLAITMFALLPILFGLLIVPLQAMLEPILTKPRSGLVTGLILAAGLAPLAIGGTISLIIVILVAVRVPRGSLRRGARGLGHRHRRHLRASRPGGDGNLRFGVIRLGGARDTRVIKFRLWLHRRHVGKRQCRFRPARPRGSSVKNHHDRLSGCRRNRRQRSGISRQHQWCGRRPELAAGDCPVATSPCRSRLQHQDRQRQRWRPRSEQQRPSFGRSCVDLSPNHRKLGPKPSHGPRVTARRFD